MNRYLKNLSKIEFVVTDACTGRCRHCSQGEHSACGGCIDPAVAAETVRKIAAVYDIRTVMTFGGEPLLYPEAVCSVLSAAREMGVVRRQIITNGYFTKDADRMNAVARSLAECGANDLLLSVDAFHQETIPLQEVKLFARAAAENGIPVRLQPAWLVSPENDNPYNRKTREILDEFRTMGLYENEGNIVFPEGNARKYLAVYYSDSAPANPYVEDPHDVRCISVSANGDVDVLGGNVCRQNIMEIIESYKP